MSQKAHTKAAKVRRLLQRPKGASLPAICKATGWQPHTTRAFLSGLRKKGYGIERHPGEAEGGVAVYRITRQPADAS